MKQKMKSEVDRNPSQVFARSLEDESSPSHVSKLKVERFKYKIAIKTST
jgi:hypothetical protein